DGADGWGGSGAGLGGAVFLRQGTLSLEKVSFRMNMAIGGEGSNPGLGKGGAIFVMPQSLEEGEKEEKQGKGETKVIFIGEMPEFSDNHASNALSHELDNNNWFGPCRKAESSNSLGRIIKALRPQKEKT
ncbi:MAG: hypothetical protein AB8B70_08235, partial [Prochlorococcus sp.]